MPARDAYYRPSAGVLRKARRRAGLSQRAVAQRLGVSQSYVSLIERGLRDPPLSSMGAFAEALGYELTVAFRAGYASFKPIR